MEGGAIRVAERRVEGRVSGCVERFAGVDVDSVVLEEGRGHVEFGLQQAVARRREEHVIGVEDRVEDVAGSVRRARHRDVVDPVRGVLVQPREQDVGPRDELGGGQQAALSDAALLRKGLSGAVGRVDLGGAPRVDVAHQANRPVGDVEPCQGLRGCPVRD